MNFIHRLLLLVAVLVVNTGVATATATAKELSPARLYSKIKIRLNGSAPTPQEYRKLEDVINSCQKTGGPQATQVCLDDFYKSEIARFMSAPAFEGKGVEFVLQLMYLRLSGRPWEIREQYEVAQDNSLTRLAERIFSKNLSWDEFFTSSEFVVKRGGGGFGDSGFRDINFFSQYIPESAKPLKEGHSFYVQIDNPDLAGGFMITPTFNARYFNNPVNEGRKRAAAVMRIGLCDPMFPAIERGEEHKGLEDKIAKGLSFDDIVNSVENQAALHGRQRDCAQCHTYRGLDHLAWTFRATELVLDTRAASGRFTYLRQNGDLVDHEVRGIGHFAQILVKQPEFVECQVTNFWKEFVGSEQYLEDRPELKKRLVKAFDQRNRAVQDFIAYLMMTPEFRSEEVEELQKHPLFAKAERVLVNCNNCHSGMQPSFTSLPIGFNGEDQTEQFVDRIIERLAIEPWSHSNNRSMPPASSAWQPTSGDLKAVRDWIAGGAPDAQGTPHLSADWLKAKGIGGQQ